MENQFEKLDVWKKCHELTLKIYQETQRFPTHEKFSLTDQLRRAATSVPANIVEGNTRNSRREFIQFVYIAKGSLEETKYFLLLSYDLRYITRETYQNLQLLAVRCGKLISGFLRFLKSYEHPSKVENRKSKVESLA